MSTASPLPTGPGHTGSRRWSRQRLVVILLALLGTSLAVLWAPGVIAAAYLGSALAPFGVACAPLSVEVAWDVSRGRLQETECTIARGPVASAAASDVVVSLVDLAPTDVEVGALSINPRDVGDTGDDFAALLLGEVPAPMQRALHGLAALSAREELPHVTIRETSVGRGHVLLLRDLVVGRDEDGLSLRIASAGPPPHLGRVARVAVAIEDVVAHATPAVVTIEGRVSLDAVLASTELVRSIPFRLSGSDLETDAPRYELWIEPSPLLERARAGVLAMRARIEAAGGRVEAVHRAIVERGAERSERLDALRESLEPQGEGGARAP